MSDRSDIRLVQMADDDDRFVTRPVYIPEFARKVAVMVPDLQNASIVRLDVSPFPHIFNYPAPNYYVEMKKPTPNPWSMKKGLVKDFKAGGVIAEWRLDDPDGTTATDEVSKYVLTEQGNPTWQSSAAVGGLGSGVAFDGTGDILDVAIASAANLDITTGDFTVEIVAKLTSGSNASKVLLEHRGASDGVGYSIYTDASERLSALIEDASGEVTCGGDTDIADGTIKHLVVTFDRDGNVTPYINGTAGTTGDISSNTGTLSNTGRFAVGGDSDRSALVTGTIYFVRVYNRVLDATEVGENYKVLIGNQFPGWIPVINLTIGEDADLVASGYDPAALDITPWLIAFKGCYVRFRMATEQTTSQTYNFGFIFSSE